MASLWWIRDWQRCMFLRISTWSRAFNMRFLFNNLISRVFIAFLFHKSRFFTIKPSNSTRCLSHNMTNYNEMTYLTWSQHNLKLLIPHLSTGLKYIFCPDRKASRQWLKQIGDSQTHQPSQRSRSDSLINLFWLGLRKENPRFCEGW